MYLYNSVQHLMDKIQPISVAVDMVIDSMCVCVCVRACVRACVRVCVRACTHEHRHALQEVCFDCALVLCFVIWLSALIWRNSTSKNTHYYINHINVRDTLYLTAHFHK